MPFKLQIIIREAPGSVMVDIDYYDGVNAPTARELETFEAMKKHLSTFKIPNVEKTFPIPKSRYS